MNWPRCTTSSSIYTPIYTGAPRPIRPASCCPSCWRWKPARATQSFLNPGEARVTITRLVRIRLHQPRVGHSLAQRGKRLLGVGERVVTLGTGGDNDRIVGSVGIHYANIAGPRHLRAGFVGKHGMIGKPRL